MVVAEMKIILSKWEDMALIKELDECITNNKPFYNLGIEWFIYERIQDFTNDTVVYRLEVFKCGSL